MPPRRAKNAAGAEPVPIDAAADSEAKLNALVEELEVEGELFLILS
jgi:hypothetical protein